MHESAQIHTLPSRPQHAPVPTPTQPPQSKPEPRRIPPYETGEEEVDRVVMRCRD